MKEANLLTQALQMVETDISNTEKACLDTFMFVYVFCIFSLKKSQLFLAQGTYFCLSTVGVWSKKSQIRLGDHLPAYNHYENPRYEHTVCEEFLHFCLKLADTFK